MGSVVEVRVGTKCKAFPLLDRGPGNPKAAIDLTGSAHDILLGIKPCSQVGKKGTLKKSIPVVEYSIDPDTTRKISPGEHEECKMLVSN